MNRPRSEAHVILAIIALVLAFFSTIASAQAAVPTPAPTLSDNPAAPLLVAKITSNLSTRNAKAGDIVTAKTVRAGKLLDGTELPKGSKLLGKVASIQSKKDGNGNSLLIFRFDSVEPKGGAPVSIHGLVVAIGPELSPKDLFGANSVLNRDGGGSSNGLDPNLAFGTAGAKDEDNIRMGSSLQSVALGRHMDADWTTALRGVHTDIDLDSDVVIKVQLK
jgi:hypothetical protein